MSILEHLNSESATWSEYLGRVASVKRALDKVGLLEISGSVYLQNSWDEQCTVIVSLYDNQALEVAARNLTELCGRVEKGFDGSEKQLTVTATYKDLKIVVRSSVPSTCTVEPYEVDVDVPAVEAKPATTRKVTKYRLVGDCEPLLAPRD